MTVKTKAAIKTEVANSTANNLLGGTILNDIVDSYSDFASANLTVGTSQVTSGPNNGVLYDNGGLLGASTTLPTTVQQNITNLGIVTSDTLLKSGRPWADVRAWGAVGNGSTNDSTAFQNAINSLNALGGGTLYVPPGSYYVTGLSLSSNAIRIIGASKGGSFLTTIGSDDTTIITINTSWCSLENLYIRGKGTDSATTFGANNPAVLLGANSVSTQINHCYITGGSYALKIIGPDSRVNDSYMASGLGSAAVFITTNGAGSRFTGCSFDQSFPVSTPTNLSGQTSVPAWAGTTHYNVGDIVITQGYILQASVSGTTGSSAPTLLNFGQNIVDGGVTWLLAVPQNYYGIQMDTGVQEVYLSKVDISGGVYYACVGMTNTGAGTAPRLVRITDCIMGGSLNYGILAHDGSDLQVVGGENSNGLLKNAVGISLSSNWTGGAIISNCWMTGSVAQTTLGIDIAGTAGTNKYNTITANKIFNQGTGIKVEANLTDFSILANMMGANTTAISIASGTSNFYTIIGNDFNGSTTAVSDGGSGSNKTVEANGNWSGLGIGVAGPQQGTSFTVYNNTGSGQAVFRYDGNALGLLINQASSGGASVVNQQANSQLQFYANNGAGQFVLNPSGGVGVNTSSDPGAGMIYTNSASFAIRTKTSYNDGGGHGTSPTLGANGPTGATTPTKWIPIDDNGTTRYIPAW